MSSADPNSQSGVSDGDSTSLDLDYSTHPYISPGSEEGLFNAIIDDEVELTQDWIKYLLTLRDVSSEPGDAERPSKRAKLISDSPSIPILRRELTITCRADSESVAKLQALHLDLPNVEKHLSFIDDLSTSLTIGTRDNAVPKLVFKWDGINVTDNGLRFILQVAWYYRKSLTRGDGTGPKPRRPSMYNPLRGGFEFPGLRPVHLTDVEQFQVATRLRFGKASAGRVTLRFFFELRLLERWTIAPKPRTEASRQILNDALEMLQPGGLGMGKTGSCEPRDFYRAAFATDDKDKQTLHVDGLASTLYPFQQRAIRWLLRREGVQWVDDIGDGNSGPVPIQDSTATPIESHAHTLEDADGEDFHVDFLFDVVSRDNAQIAALESQVRGGILAEEMGLGKTVEIIALILLHRRQNLPVMVMDPYLGGQVRPTSATLIVTPPALQDQWLSELQQHAPHLNVMVYHGVGKSCEDAEAEATIVAQLALQDVVVTTYTTLQKEIHFALEPPKRSLRGERKHHRAKSPLVQLSWWRVCLDEAQQVDSGVSSAATLARIIPRVNAWAVTGTPVKDDIKDLWGLLLFLRYQPYAHNQKIWTRMITEQKESFEALFNNIALRHSKRLIRAELELPPQKRYVITIPLSTVEERWYAATLNDVTKWCGLSSKGVPDSPTWNPKDAVIIDRMKTALDRLRKTALHPTTVGVGPWATGRIVGGPMRTVAEVLDAMIEQSLTTAITSKRAALNSRLTQGQFFENSTRAKEALAIWQAVLKESDGLVLQSRERLRSLTASISENAASKGKEPADSDDEAGFDLDSAQVSEAQRSLRYALEIKHRAVFLCASAHFQIRTNPELTHPACKEFGMMEKLENDGYDLAKEIRGEILQESRGKAYRVMEKISKRPSSKDAKLFIDHHPKPPRGIKLHSTMEKINALGDCLNAQAHYINDWRKKAIELVLKELLDQDDDDVTGEEFADSTMVQEDLMVYITVLRVAVQDRKAALVGHASTYVAEDEVRRAQQQAEDDNGPSPEKMLSMLDRRAIIRPSKELSCAQALVTELRDIGIRIQREAGWRGGAQGESPEELMVNAELARTQKWLESQQKALVTMNQDLLDLTSAMNARIEFYRQLQAISDTVAPYEGSRDEAALALIRKEGDKLTKKAAAAESQHRYLMALKDSDSGDETHTCTICLLLFSEGVLTVCGHTYCKDCLEEWFKQKRSCPQCKRVLGKTDLHDITLKRQKLGFHLEGNQAASGEWRADPKKAGIYTTFSDRTLANIRNIALPGTPLTAKLSMITKHLVWLRTADPGAKTIVFSQYPTFLETLSDAFSQHNVNFTTFTDRGGITKFKEDPSVECFLLHARAHASGLNLVNASHVILCEPLLNTALELQAIARVHRIGQKRATTVWLYVVEGTVEESVYTLSVRRRMQHVEQTARQGSDQEEGIEISNSEDLEQAKLGSLMMRRQKGQEYGGEAIAEDDLYECLFGKPRSSIGKYPRDDDDLDDHRADGQENGLDMDGLMNQPLVRRQLVGDAADQRHDNGEGSSRVNGVSGSL